MFLDYDLRGLFPKELPPALIRSVVFQFYQKAKHLSKRSILAIDTRKSSLKIAYYLNELLPDYFDYVGILPTPIFYWLVIRQKRPGIMVTASHLPIKYNGLKFLFPEGVVWVPKINGRYQKNKWLPKSLFPKIDSSTYQDYFTYLQKYISAEKIKVNFPTNHPFGKIFRSFFPIINLSIARSKFLFQTDLDADRFILYYQKEKILPDIVFAKITLQNRYRKVAGPINMSQKIAHYLRNQGVKLIFLPTGHRYFKEAYRKKKIDFAFEPSGHFYFFQELKTESPFLALRKYLEAFEETDLLWQKSIPVFRVNLKLKGKVNLAKLVQDLALKLKPEKIKKFDGYFFQAKEGWCHFRLSKTENKLRVFGEGPVSLRKKYLQAVRRLLR